MPRYFTGDELGSIKSVSFKQTNGGKEWETSVDSLIEGSSSASRSRAIQKLVLTSNPEGGSEKLLAAARADGSTSVFHITGETTTLQEQSSWKENRLKQTHKYVGLSFGKRGVYSCTSNGALRLTTLISEDSADAQQDPNLAVLPTRLAEWQLASDEQTFAYAGDEVELSIWDTERAFSSDSVQSIDEGKAVGPASRKRKRTEQLLSGEVWRAKNLPNDSLNLRQPVRNTAFTYLQTSSAPSHQNILVGTQFGDVRRYDTRTARRPVSNWTGIGKTGGIGVIENGLNKNQVFVSDRGSNLYALDLRNGKISFGYKDQGLIPAVELGFSGAVTSIAVSPSFLASNAEDRYTRLHSTFPPPDQVGQQQEHKGEVLEKTYVNVVPTVVLWDGTADASAKEAVEDEEAEGGDDEMWDNMESAESDDEDGKGRKKDSR
ncbi:hypothetical protein BDY19DRAFT_1044938 [Irpex rosettiformis]|uniref:Uncharacterized protein n=1 Tax=Irpex rosettiformis TaxID=378272 RepID=A0ACB8UH44_9APHY|nr:hypothetical protein BDY19DRAFT_1044938 [Irpex rosettiformis]